MAIRKTKTERPATLTRVAKFEIKPSPEQLRTLQKVSDNLWLVWNEALGERSTYFDAHLQPLYEQRKAGHDVAGELKAAFEKAPTYFEQSAALTQKRQDRADFAAVPFAWQQETLKILDGAFKSFAQLRHKGDQKAKPPQEKSPHRFCEIQGVSSFQVHCGNVRVAAQEWLTPLKQDALKTSAEVCSIVLSPGKVLPGGAVLSFELPTYQHLLLAQAVKLNKFTVVRDSHGRFWCSIAYAIEKPEGVKLVPEEVVFLTLGASFIGVVSREAEETIDLWRPDHYWMPRISAKKALRDKCVKGSRRWRWLTTKINRDYERLRNQQLDNQRKVVAQRLQSHGVHFIIATHSPIRAKKGRLADKSQLERSGALGLNWSAQNTGSLARLRQILEQKTAEWGGSVSMMKLEYPRGPKLGRWPDAHRAIKVIAARKLRQEYLANSQ